MSKARDQRQVMETRLTGFKMRKLHKYKHITSEQQKHLKHDCNSEQQSTLPRSFLFNDTLIFCPRGAIIVHLIEL